MKTIAIYPGTFDPITKGHLDIIRRASNIVDTLIVAVAKDTGKNPIFTQKERTELVEGDVKDLEKIINTFGKIIGIKELIIIMIVSIIFGLIIELILYIIDKVQIKKN